MKKRPGIRFVTAEDLLRLYEEPVARRVDRSAVAKQLSRGIIFGEIGGAVLSPAEMLMSLLDVAPQVVDGPVAPGKTTFTKTSIPAAAFRAATQDAAAFIARFQRLPNEVFIGAETLSLADFAATLAGSYGKPGDVPVVRGRTEFDRHFATDGRKSYNWVIHPEGFDGAPLLELARLQGWTLKPARLRR
jgi:hypothetical protein